MDRTLDGAYRSLLSDASDIHRDEWPSAVFSERPVNPDAATVQRHLLHDVLMQSLDDYLTEDNDQD
jgi:hypothetical protein